MAEWDTGYANSRIPRGCLQPACFGVADQRAERGMTHIHFLMDVMPTFCRERGQGDGYLDCGGPNPLKSVLVHMLGDSHPATAIQRKPTDVMMLQGARVGAGR